MNNSLTELQNLINAHHEWLLVQTSGRSFALQKNELEIDFERGRLLFGFLDDKGFQTWRVVDFQTKGAEIVLRLTRNFETEHDRIRLVPRTSSAVLSDAVELARVEKADRLAAAVKEKDSRFKIVRVSLNKENGRLAQIIFEDINKRRRAILADASGQLTPEFLLLAGCRQLAKLEKRKRFPINEIWLIGEKKTARGLQKLHPLLQKNWQSRIFVKESATAENNPQVLILKDLPQLETADLWRGRIKQIKLPENQVLSETAKQIIESAPLEIDVVCSKQGETLRFAGLPFARVRKTFGAEKCWFGIEREKRLLTKNNSGEFGELLETLHEFRHFDAPHKRHAFYKSAPEAWLEAILRRNIHLLDANLVLSPVYHQFRAEFARLDLLALRRDGRLVIIELKTAPDREMLWQAVDYWRQIERLRRRGSLQQACLFGELEIKDAPAVLYLAAPRLSFHRDFDFAVQTVTPDIEIHRFNLNENWRETLRVLERQKLNAESF